MFSKNNYIVNLGNIKYNVKAIRKTIGDKVKICAIVKANAYGLGLKSVVGAIKESVDFFGVANADEAKELRLYDCQTPILILGEVNLDSVSWCAKRNVSVTISSIDSIYYILNNYKGKKLNVHLAVNTGLNRIGFYTTKQFVKAIKLIKASNNMVLEGCFTHFATKQNDLNFIEKQYKTFEKFTRLLPKGVIVHCANSFETLNHKLHHCNMVRPGFALYGEHNSDCSLKPVLTITSQIVHITNVKAGESVGYDRTCVAKSFMKVAVVPIGYADGLDRRLSNNFYLLVNGKRANIVGNICMDVTLIDVTYIPYVYVGSAVTIIGSSGKEVLRPIDYAKCLNTSPYEVLLKFNYKRMNYITINE